MKLKIMFSSILFYFLSSCSASKDCESERQKINAQIDKEIDIIKNYTIIDYRKISYLESSRAEKLNNACD